MRNWMGAPGRLALRFAADADGPAGRAAAAGRLPDRPQAARAASSRAAGAGRSPLSFLGIALIGAAAGLFAGGAVNGLVGGLGRRDRARHRRPDRAGARRAGRCRRRRAVPDRRSSPSPRRSGSSSASPASASPPRRSGWLANRRFRREAMADARTKTTTSRCAARPRSAVVPPRRAAPPAHRRPPPRARRAAARCASASPRSRSATATPCPRSTCSTRRRQPVNVVLDKAALERNARLLESVLDDFSVKGEIVEVRPGPVVTMYELEPASGIKASRVIQLADDIARNMSALSARVATIPGRSVIGIELPNAKREMVSFSRAGRQPRLRGPGRLAADHPRQEHRRRSGRRRSRADAASARRRHHRLGQVGRASTA